MLKPQGNFFYNSPYGYYTTKIGLVKEKSA